MARINLILEADIKQIVSQNSGGIKFTALLTALLDRGYPEEKGISSSTFLDDVEDTVREANGLSVLDYSWDMGNSQLRSKMFVYEVH